MARKNKTPLYQTDDKLDPEYTEENTDETITDETTTDDSLLGSDVLQSDLFRDKVHGTDTTMFSSPREIDATAIDERIAEIEKPAGKTVWDKQAAYYRQKGEGDVLRGQKDWAALTSPTITLYNERVAAADAKFELLKQQIPETDFSTIFGENGESKIPMPIVDEVKNISATVKADLKELSRMNINDPRYDELRKKVEKDQDMLVAFDEINQKLLTIRNDIESNGNDSTQWSKGMSEGTRRMWMDIYTGEGKNIHIIDGKLQWVDPGGVSYEFDGNKDAKLKFFDDKAGGNYLGRLVNYTENDDGTNKKFENGDTSWEIKYIQQYLIRGGFTDHEDRELEQDGEWGPRSQAAYEKYLSQKNDLENEYFDENMSDEQKKEYQEKGILVTKGGGAVKDLSKIGDEPIMNSAKAQELSFQMQNYMTASIQAGANAKGDFAAQTKYKQALNNINVMYDGLSIQDQTSLLFDGMGAEDNTSVNTSSFIDNILAANEGLKLDDLIEGGLTESYKDPNDPDCKDEKCKKTLRTMFKDWYLNEVKSQTSSLKPPRESSNSSNNNTKKYNLTNSSAIFSLNKDNQYSTKYGNKTQISKVKLEKGEISLTKKDIKTLTGRDFANDPNEEKYNIDYKITTDGVVQYYEDGKWKNSDIRKKSDNTNNIEDYNTLINTVNEVYETSYGTGTEFEYKTEKYYLENEKGKYINIDDFDKIADGSATWSQAEDVTDWSGVYSGSNPGDHILDFRDDDFIVDVLNSEYGDAGFTFEDNGRDEIKVTYSYGPGASSEEWDILEWRSFTFKTNFIKSSSRQKQEEALIAWMKGVVEEDSTYWNQDVKYTKDGQYINSDGSIDF